MSVTLRLVVLNLLALALVFAEQQGDQQPSPFNIAEKIKAISTKYSSAKSYLYEGDMTVDGQKGDGPVTLLRKAHFKLASAEGGKSFYEMHTEGQDDYQMISNGQKSWIVAPGKKQYTAEESASAGNSEEDEEVEGGELTDHYARVVAPTLKTLASTARAGGFYGLTPLKINGNKGKWPILRLELKAKEDEPKPVIEVVFDPDTLAIGRITYANVYLHGGERTFTRAVMRFDRFTSGDVPDEMFNFDPPKGAKQVETIAVAGQSGILVGHPAPDFELKTLDGDKVHLSSLRGQPVLLSFWASWCPPCRAELPILQKLSGEFKGKGLQVYGVNDEGKTAAKHYASKVELTFPTLDDGEQKANRLYGVRSIPTVFLIDRDGKVVKLLHGGHPEDSFREALKTLGL